MKIDDRLCIKVSTLLALFLLATTPINAAVLTFEGDICGGPCLNSSEISQDYGDIAGEIDVVYDGSVTLAGNQPLFWWDSGYIGLSGVAYSQGSLVGLSILFDSLPGYGVLIDSFFIAPYLGRVTTTSIQISDVGTNTVLFQTGPFSPSTTDPTAFLTTYSSESGLRIDFGPDAWDVGIDTITYRSYALGTDPGPSPVPLPASGLLLLVALAVGAAAVRRR